MNEENQNHPASFPIHLRLTQPNRYYLKDRLGLVQELFVEPADCVVVAVGVVAGVVADEGYWDCFASYCAELADWG